MDQPLNQTAPVTAQPQSAEPTSAPVQSERDRIYAQYYQQETQTNTPATQETPTAAPATVETPVQQAPAPVQAAPTVDPAISALIEEVKALRAQVGQPAQVAPPAMLSPAEQKDWVALMAEGRQAEGEKLLAQKVEREISERIQGQALERMEANRTMYEFTTKIRTDNPDLTAMEDYIAYAAKAQIDQAVAQGKIKTPADYATVYKSAVTAEVEKARNLANTLRGVGKNEALTRSREVVSTQTIQPQAINQNREAAPSDPQPESVEDYFKARQNRSLAGRGLSVG